MPSTTYREQLALARHVAKWTMLALPMAALVGSASALFLWLLDVATRTRIAYPALLYALPLAGLCVAALYTWAGKEADRGNNLIMDEIHEPGGGVPLRMTPLILLGTVATHFCGGSAGREGTAVQMGGSLAGWWARVWKLPKADVRILLTSGIAAGFGAVFGTPVAGAVFAMEVLTQGRLRYDALIPCLFAALAGDWICTSWGIHHTPYHLASAASGMIRIDPTMTAKVFLAAAAFGVVSTVFAELTHRLTALLRQVMPSPLVRPVVGGVVIIVLTTCLGTYDYLGLGVTSASEGGVSIVSCFQSEGATPWSWWWKLLFTVLTLSTGYKGGEVTPLFFMGAALGNAVSALVGGPVDLFAALGFIAVFAGATNTPVASTLMGIELFGSYYTPYFALACFVAYWISGRSSIYTAQRTSDTRDTPTSGTGR